jgi:recombination protein RecT
MTTNEIAKQDHPLKTQLMNLAMSESVKSIATNVKPDRIASLFLAEAAKNNILYNVVSTTAGKASLVSFFMLSAQLGLEPGSALGLMYPMPKRNRDKDWTILPVIGYKGYCELARRSGAIKSIVANPVYKDEIEKGLFKASRHPASVEHGWSPDVDMSDENLVAAYAVVELNDGTKLVHIMSRAQIVARAKRGASYGGSGPWATDFAAMARKTVLRAMLANGTVPLTQELSRAVAGDADSEVTHEPIEATVIEATPVQQKTGEQHLLEAIGASGDSPEILDAIAEESGTASPVGLKVVE